MADPEPRRRGRPRNEETRLSILAAAFALGAGDEEHEFSVAGIAARAGVGKQTVYRWWPTKGDVLLEALVEHADLQVSTADRGAYADDLLSFLRDTFDVLEDSGIVNALRNLMVEAQHDREFKGRFREGFMDRRRSALGQIMDRAGERGDLPDTLDRELAADVVFGVIWYRMLATSRPLGEADAATLATLLAGTGRTAAARA
jgi:AcrR family transcriptional regulator